jgi:hypothetical protein
MDWINLALDKYKWLALANTVRHQCMDWIFQALDRDKWQALVNTLSKLPVAQTAGNTKFTEIQKCYIM